MRTPLAKTLGVTLAGLVCAVLGVAFFPCLDPAFAYGPRGGVPPTLALVVKAKLFVTTFNLVVLLALMRSYLAIYRGLANKYTRSLIALSVLLLLYAATSNPLLQLLLGLSPRPSLGVFLFLPDLFVGMAIVVLYYQSQT